jgi:hypothetical protein
VSSILELPARFRPTHETSGLAGYPAVDVFGRSGELVGSPGYGRVVRESGQAPTSRATPGGPYGFSIYLVTRAGTYFLTHLGRLLVGVGAIIRPGQAIGTVAPYSEATGGVTPSHVHEGFHAGPGAAGTSGPSTATPGGLPPELAQAINNASSRYGVPASVLAGIWRIESGGRFPNPYVNSSGYGGLFGTTHWNTSTQDQAYYAASILARLLRASGGNLAAALRAYSGGGYSSVPGGPVQVTPGGAGAGGEYQQPGRPGGDVQSVGLFSDLTGGLGWIGHEITHAIGGGVGFFGGGLGGVWNAIKGFIGAFLFLLDPRNWLRMFEALTGFSLLLLGFYWYGKDEGGPDLDVGQTFRHPVSGGQRIASTAGRGVQASAEGAARSSTTARVARKAAKLPK